MRDVAFAAAKNPLVTFFFSMSCVGVFGVWSIVIVALDVDENEIPCPVKMRIYVPVCVEF